MPLTTVRKYEHHRFVDTYTYVPGSTMTSHQVRAAKRYVSPHDWQHDSVMPPAGHFAWIVPLHALLAFVLYVAVDAQTVPGHIWMGILSAIVAWPACLFWKHIYFNGILYNLRKSLAIRDTRNDTRWHFLIEGTYENRRAEGFSNWLHSQLRVDAPYFSRVHIIVDDYLRATDHALRLEKSFEQFSDSWKEVRELIETASQTAYEKLLPLHQEAVEAEKQRLKEEKERLAIETAFREGEERQITQQRITMAREDIEKYKLGQSLSIS